MTATLRAAFSALSRISGSCGSFSCSTMKRLTWRIASAPSRDERMHLLSHGWKQTRAQMLASGLRSRCIFSASS